MGICCFSSNSNHSSGSKSQEAEARNARIVPILNSTSYYPNTYTHRSCYSPPPLNDNSIPPPRYEDATPDQPLPFPIELLDEKDRFLLVPTQPQSTGHSSRSSIISIPSTRLTDLTSVPTGTTSRTTVTGDVRRNVTGRSSWSSGRPPSYYADTESRTSRSRSLDNEDEARDMLHPVMADGWFERLRKNARNGDHSQERG